MFAKPYRLALGLVIAAAVGVLCADGTVGAQLFPAADEAPRRIPVRAAYGTLDDEGLGSPTFRRADTNGTFAVVPAGYALAITDITMVNEPVDSQGQSYHNIEITDDSNVDAVDANRVQLVGSLATSPGYHYTSPVWVVREGGLLRIRSFSGTPILYLHGYLIRSSQLGL